MEKELAEVIDGMKPEYQCKLAHLLYVTDDVKFSLAVIDKSSGEIILRDTDAAPLWGK